MITRILYCEYQNDNDNTASIAIQFLVPPSKKLINMSNGQLYIYIIVCKSISLFLNTTSYKICVQILLCKIPEVGDGEKNWRMHKVK